MALSVEQSKSPVNRNPIWFDKGYLTFKNLILLALLKSESHRIRHLKYIVLYPYKKA